MRTRLPAALIALGVLMIAMISPALAADLTNSTALTYTDPTLGSMPYRLYLPDSYDPSGPALPVVLFLHGAGGRGTDNVSQLGNIGPLIQETQHGTHQAILIAPQVPKNQQWVGVNANDNWTVGAYHNSQATAITSSMQLAMDILTDVLTTKQADSRRVYVTGLSMGGYGTWDAIARFPDRFACALPLSGGGNLDSASVLKNKGIWAYHGASDTIVPPSGSTDMINAIIAAGGGPVNKDGDLIYTLAGGKGHQGWDGFYTPDYMRTDGRVTLTSTGYGRDVYDWMFSYTLVPEPGAISVLMLASGTVLLRRPRRV